jgi:hypothetical protein
MPAADFTPIPAERRNGTWGCALIGTQPNADRCELDESQIVGREPPPPRESCCHAPSGATHILIIVVRDAGSVLVHAHDGGIDHLQDKECRAACSEAT